MRDYTIRQAKTIPYFDHDNKSLWQTIRHSSSRREMNPVVFALRKMRNILYSRWSFRCPLNGIRVKLNRRRGVTIGDNVYVGLHCVIDNAYPEYIYIEDNVSIAESVQIIAHSNPYPHFQGIVESSVAPIVIKEGAWIGSGAIILRGVTIGENAIVSAGTVVDRNIPPCSIVQGNPMKIVTSFEALMQ